MVVEIFERFASRRALEQLDNQPDGKQDLVYRQSIQWNSDVLVYLELRSAIRTGDVGRIEDLLPTLLFRFAGGGNSKYAIEVLETLQGLRQEWTPEVRTYVKHCCWLLTTSGKENGFLPYDLGQEHNIGDIKVNYYALGPGASMSNLTKISPAIPTLRKVKESITDQFTMLKGRGKHHHIPNKEEDIKKLTASYLEAELYIATPGRKVASVQDIAEDYITKGYCSLWDSSTISDWFKRRTRTRGTEEDWV
ncbi:hypothetical protein EYR40_011107 [Pleurotus pulmonarius]|nr:hypothetical protein EYR40_011107 [Pleurotus pulmonarius]